MGRACTVLVVLAGFTGRIVIAIENTTTTTIGRNTISGTATISTDRPENINRYDDDDAVVALVK